MSEQRDRSSDFEPLRFLGKGYVRRRGLSEEAVPAWTRPAKVGGTP